MSYTYLLGPQFPHLGPPPPGEYSFSITSVAPRVNGTVPQSEMRFLGGRARALNWII